MLWIPIDRSLDIPLIRQIYGQIRGQILGGDLQFGDKLPSTRELSEQLKVSRNVVLEAYDQLLAEGFLLSERGSGTYVAEGTFLEQTRLTSPYQSHLVVEDEKIYSDVINFRSGIPALDEFPRKTWMRLSQSIWNEAPSTSFGYGMPEGQYKLRYQLSRYLLKTRGVDCHPDQIVITSGATQALTLVSKLLLTQGDHVIIEDPITHDIQTIFTNAGAQLYPIPADENGMQTSLLPQHIGPKFVFLTPSHHFPLGGTLPIQRRIQLVNYARHTNGYLVEDDYDSEFRHEGTPVSSLQGLEPERVLYIGSFSKILSPALRLGYLILPIHLIEQCRRLKWFSDLHTSSLDQLILARFIEQGYLEKHVTKMKKLYKGRREVLIESLKEMFTDQMTIKGYTTGLHLIAEWKDVYFTEVVLAHIESFGVKVYPVESHTLVKGKHTRSIIIGYGHLTNEQIREGVSRLHQALLNNAH
ncbi:PLP-dependent aminotransferase family protein [Paenibacillus sp. GSMTC-2017]|uniref:MocR-like pyridoxine biosynthesis transcription factor PdxR n=1 Tax=Paenibacillus sp. GSMTC-2017 TaxID=2794350 RepID=UPI0018D8DB20|nr:PLP-dependent aminotransferase family protein [Paenibacillus sp. GSMTC-2017]MBH5320428.1 PLP-dependent aminotransferase family protein [Paenibacillus sp. GSMTC-2017]